MEINLSIEMIKTLQTAVACDLYESEKFKKNKHDKDILAYYKDKIRRYKEAEKMLNELLESEKEAV